MNSKAFDPLRFEGIDMGLFDRLEGKSAGLAAFEKSVRAAEDQRQVRPAQNALVQSFKGLSQADQSRALDFLLRGLYATTFESCATKSPAAPSVKAFESAAETSNERLVTVGMVAPRGYRIPEQDQDQAQPMFLDAYRRLQAADQKEVLDYLTKNGDGEIFSTCSTGEPWTMRPQPTRPSSDAADDSNPLKYDEFLSSAALKGRGTPSPGLNAADKAVIDLLQKYGATGPDRQDPQSPYCQTFRFEGGQAQNVMGLFPGTGPHKDQVVVVMAHLDHLGVEGGKLYPGADDNGSGSSVLMSSVPAIAQAQKDGKLDRSVLFVWTAGEEEGLIGSDYFVHHPIPGLELPKISAVLNADMVGRLDNHRLSVGDTDRDGKTNYLEGLIQAANKDMADPFQIKHDIDEYRDRQDGAEFSDRGRPTAFIFEGLTDDGELNPDYHQPTDTVDKILKDNGGQKLTRVRDFLTDLIARASDYNGQLRPSRA